MKKDNIPGVFAALVLPKSQHAPGCKKKQLYFVFLSAILLHVFCVSLVMAYSHFSNLNGSAIVKNNSSIMIASVSISSPSAAQNLAQPEPHGSDNSYAAEFVQAETTSSEPANVSPTAEAKESQELGALSTKPANTAAPTLKQLPLLKNKTLPASSPVRQKTATNKKNQAKPSQRLNSTADSAGFTPNSRHAVSSNPATDAMNAAGEQTSKGNSQSDEYLYPVAMVSGGQAGKTAEMPISSFAAANGPSFKRFVKPVYPAAAKRQNINGQVLLRLHISAEGKVTKIEILESAHKSLSEAAIKAVKASSFFPLLKNGTPTPCRTNLPIDFVFS